MTIPKPCILLVLTAVVLTGCSTPGPLHLYSIANGGAAVHDVALDGNDAAREVPSYLRPGDVLTGFAYDPFTDHFFLRLAPGNFIRVVDRPARKIKREESIEAPFAGGSGDLAVSPRDGHLFLVDGTSGNVVEATRFGKFIRRIPLQGLATAAAAIAYDMERNRLIVLAPDGRTVTTFDRRGGRDGTFSLDRAVRPSLAFDATKAELYAPLTDTPGTVGVFDENGRCVRTVPIARGDEFIDVGPHSFLRMF